MESINLNFIPAPAFLVSKENKEIVRLNDKSANLTGLNAENLAGKKITDYIKEELLIQGEYEDVLFRTKKKLLSGCLSVQEITENKKNYFIVSYWETRNSSKDKNFQSIFERATESIVLADNKLKIINVNPAFCNLTGLLKEDIIGKSGLRLAKDFVSPISRSSVIKILKDVFAGKSVTKFEVEYRNKLIEVSSVIRNEENNIIAILRDISKQKEVQQEIVESERKYKTLIESANDSIFIVQNGLIQYVNRELIRISGYKEKELIGQRFIKFVAPAEVRKVLDYYKKRLKGEKVHDKYESSAIAKSGKLIDVNVSIIPIDYQGKPAEQVILRDISLQKEATKALRISEQKFRELANLLPEIVFEVDRELNLIYANEAIKEKLGYSLEDFKENRISVKALVDESSKKPFFESIKKNFNGIMESGNIYKTRNAKGDSKYLQFYNNPVYKDNELVGLRGIAVDITDQRKKEMTQQFLFEVSKLSFMGMGLTEYLSKIHQELRKLFLADNFYVALYNKTNNTYTFPYYVDEYDNFDSDEEVAMQYSLTDYTRKTGKGQLINQEIEKELLKNNIVKLSGGYSPIWMGAPLVDSSINEGIGVIAIQDYKNKDAYNDEDLVTFEIIAHNIGLFIDRVKILENLKLEKNKALEGEKRYKSLFNDNTSIMLLTDPESSAIVDANKAACEFYGYTYKELTSMNITDIDTLSEEQVKNEKSKAKDKGQDHYFFKHRLANGNIKHVEVYCGEIILKGNVFLYSIVHDISKRKEAEAEITRLYRAIDQTPTPVALTDLDGYFTYVNPRYCELSRYTEKELIGQHTRILKSGKQSRKFYGDLWKTISSGNTWKGEMTNKKKNGELYLEEVNIAPVFDEHGIATHYVKVSRDITEQRKMSNDLISTKEKAEESDRLKSAFLATMSHELRTPLNAIIGFSELVNKDLPFNELVDFAKIINKNGNHLLELIEDMLDLTLIESGQIKKNTEDFTLGPFLSDIWEIIKKEQEKTEKLNLSLIFKPHPDTMDLHIATDKTKLKQILLNLLKNSLKYTDKGTIEFSCLPDKQNEKPVLKFYVKDTGKGIRKEDQKIIFDRFRQLEDPHTRRHDGLGIGLSVTKNLTNLLEGTIKVDSEIGHGSTFTVFIPYQPQLRMSRSGIQTTPKLDWKGYTILLAEDEISNFDLIKAILKPTGAKLLHARNGKQAVDLCEALDNIDLILMDIRMPIMDGFIATEIIKEHHPDLPIIALTAYAMYGDKEKSFAAGCDDYIAKPIKRQFLFTVLQKYLKKQKTI